MRRAAWVFGLLGLATAAMGAERAQERAAPPERAARARAQTEPSRTVAPEGVVLNPPAPVTMRAYGPSPAPGGPGERVQVRRSFQPELERSLLE